MAARKMTPQNKAAMEDRLLTNGSLLQFYSVAVRFDNPDVSILEVGDQPLILVRRHIVRPNDLALIDVRVVVHPLARVLMIRRVADEDEVPARLSGQILDDLLAVGHLLVLRPPAMEVIGH